MKKLYVDGKILGFKARPRKVFCPFFLQCVVFSLLVLSLPFAMSFTPYERIYTDGVWNAQIQLDPLYAVRAGFIIGGILGAISSVYLLIREIAKGNESASRRILQASMALCSLQIGWVAFPYWVNGLFQVYSGKVLLADFDPYALIPMIWIGAVWLFIAGLIYIGTLAGIITLFIFNINITIHSRRWKYGIGTIVCLVMTFAIYYVTPNYMQWLAD